LKILSIFGTRPEAVKMAPVIKALSRVQEVDSLICVTAQHREMLDQVLDLFDIQPDYDLNVMQAKQSLANLTGEILTRLDPLLERSNPDWILVQGDTTTVMAAALLAFYRRIRVGHIEAGLRTGDKWQPFPEEINRKIAGVLADLHFAPTEWNRANLLKEGVEDWRIHVTGNTIVDALQDVLQHETPQETQDLLHKFGIKDRSKRLVLVTAHRRENFGQPLESICRTLQMLAQTFEDLEIFYPVHLNPNIREPVFRMLGNVPRIHLLEPQSYRSMVALMQHATLILTDSGGIQEEATALQKPTLVLREVTERPEGIETGVLKLVGADPDRILKEASRLLMDDVLYHRLTHTENPYGDGTAAEKIVRILLENHNINKEVPSSPQPV
jgi:UDP-N-acetylglucosamine 2-epimerase (non-hydrolysing)